MGRGSSPARRRRAAGPSVCLFVCFWGAGGAVVFSSLVFCSPALGFCFRSEDGSRVSRGESGVAAGLPTPAGRADSGLGTPASRLPRGLARESRVCFRSEDGWRVSRGEVGSRRGTADSPGSRGFPGARLFLLNPLPWAGVPGAASHGASWNRERKK